MIKYSIIIVAYKDMRSVAACLASLPKHPATEILVIDNTNHNRGFGAACNEAARLARGSILLFLNPDCQFHSGDLSAWLDQLNGPKAPGIVGAKLLDQHELPYLSYSRQPTAVSAPLVYSFVNRLFKQAALIKRHWYHHQVAAQPIEVGIVSGAALAISQKTFTAVNGFDQRFFLYWEEVDLCRRVLNHSQTVIFDPSVAFIHHGETSTRTIKAQALNWFKESRFTFFKKHFGTPYALLLESGLTLTEEWRLVVLLLLSVGIGTGYYLSGFWLMRQLVPPWWFWAGLASVLVFIGTAKEAWPHYTRFLRVTTVMASLLMLLTAPFQWMLALPLAVAWSIADLNARLKPIRDKVHLGWTLASIVAALILLFFNAPYAPPHKSLPEWQNIIQVARIRVQHNPAAFCIGCNDTDRRIISRMIPVADSAASAPVLIVLPPNADSTFLDAITTRVGDVLIVWPMNE